MLKELLFERIELVKELVKRYDLTVSKKDKTMNDDLIHSRTKVYYITSRRAQSTYQTTS